MGSRTQAWFAYSALFLTTMLAGCSAGAQNKPVRTVALSRTIRLPVQVAEEGSAVTNPASLAMTPGGPDEVREGPASFAVREDGGFIIADPVRRRLALYDSAGKFQNAWNIQFAADAVRILDTGEVAARQATTGDWRLFSKTGEPRPDQPKLTAPPPARLLGANKGTVPRAGQPDLSVEFQGEGLRLVALENLGTDSKGDTYVALELTPGGEAVNVRKHVRKYSPDGTLTAQITDIPLDYDVQPNDELRVRNGVVYHLMPAKEDVRIHVWSMQ